MYELAHQIRVTRPAPKIGEACPACLVGTIERERVRLLCDYCGHRAGSVVFADWDPEAKR